MPLLPPRLRAVYVFVLLIAAGLASPSPHAQTNPQPASFSEQTWRTALQTPRDQASVWVFTTSDCTHCPAVIDALHDSRSQLRAGFAIHVVQMDDARIKYHPAYTDTLGGPQNKDRIFLFDGNSRRIQYAVNPQWRGATPYIALLPTQGDPSFVLGAVSTRQLQGIR